MSPIIITGMHRSGTSLTTAIIKKLGVFLGNKGELMPPAPDNADGFYERWDVWRLNEALLKRADASWHTPPASPDFWKQGLEIPLNQLRDKAGKIIGIMNSHPVWAMKDPRFSLTLGFWREWIPEARYLICIRDQLEVALSLNKREGFDEPYALNLWHTYYQWLEASIPKEQRLVIHYQDLLDKSGVSILRLCDWLELSPDTQALALAKRGIKPQLNHHRIDKYHIQTRDDWAICHERWAEEAREGLDNYIDTIPVLDVPQEVNSSPYQERDTLPASGQNPPVPGLSDEPPPLNALSAFMESIAGLNEYIGDNALLAYQLQILENGSLSVVSPMDGEITTHVDCLCIHLSANKIAYGFKTGEIPFWIISGDRQFAYPLAWLLCPAQKYLIRLSDGSAGAMSGQSTFEYWLGRIEAAMNERGNIRKENKTGYPVITLGHQNFAHHLWNELPALEEWLSRTTKTQRQSTRLLPVQEPLGLLEQIFPELEPTQILRTERSLLAINQIAGCLVPVGSRKISQRLRARVGAHLAREAGHFAQNFEKNLTGQHKPIVWISVRDHDRTCINQEEFLAALATSILHTYPESVILFDGFAFPPGESESDTIIANEQRAKQTVKTIAAIKAKIRVADMEARVHSLSGISLLDNLYLGRFVDYYICHAGTLQHKLGWLYDVPGTIHTLNGKEQDYRPVAAWYAGQVENGRKPHLLPGEYLLPFHEDKPAQADRNRNYLITRIYEAVQRILQDMNTSLSTLKSTAMTDRITPDLPYEYRLIHSTQVIPLATPVRLDERTPIHPRLALKKARLPDTGVAIIPNGKACLELPCQYYDADGNEIREVFDPIAIRPGRSLPEEGWVKLQGRVCPIVVAGGGIYAHWLGDILPAMHLLQLAGIALDSIDHWIVNRTDLAYHSESLDLLGIDRDKVIPWSRDLRFIQADELIVPTRTRTHLYTGQWIIEWLRKLFVPAWPSLSKRPGATRLYLSREKASKRVVTNEAEVIEMLMAYGFQVLYLEKMPLTEAARLLAQAEVIVAPHGAGLANMVFCTPGTRLLELYSWHISQEYWMTAATLGLNYANLACPGPDGQYYDETELDYGSRFPEINSANMTVDGQALKHFLEEYVPVPPPRAESQSLLPPVFIFAACWRTGSTLVQRLLNTSDQLMIWGEPGYLDLMRRVYEMMTRQASNQEKIWENLLSTGLSDQWVPNLAPKKECTQEALKGFFNQLYYSSAMELKPSCRAWGMKEVRAGAMDNTLFIHQIIPDARFIFLFRDPVDCFESVIASNFYRHFEDPLFPMKVYANNMRSILALRDAPPAYKYHILRYEDLIGDEWKITLDDLFEFVGVPHPEITESVIQGKKLGGSVDKMPLPDDLRLQLAGLMGSLPGQLGYEIY